jgi:hypothetical protein
VYTHLTFVKKQNRGLLSSDHFKLLHFTLIGKFWKFYHTFLTRMTPSPHLAPAVFALLRMAIGEDRQYCFSFNSRICAACKKNKVILARSQSGQQQHYGVDDAAYDR